MLGEHASHNEYQLLRIPVESLMCSFILPGRHLSVYYLLELKVICSCWIYCLFSEHNQITSDGVE